MKKVQIFLEVICINGLAAKFVLQLLHEACQTFLVTFGLGWVTHKLRKMHERGAAYIYARKKVATRALEDVRTISLQEKQLHNMHTKKITSN